MSAHPGRLRLQRHVLDELGTAERLAVEEHLAQCARCRLEVDVARRCDALVVECLPPLPEDAAQQAFDRLWASLDGSDASARGGSPARAGGAAAARRAIVAARGMPAVAVRLVHVVPRWGLAAAALLGAGWWLGSRMPADGAAVGAAQPLLAARDELSEPALQPEPLAATQCVAFEPAVLEGATVPALDAGRLQAVRAEVAAVLCAADERAPSQSGAFQLECESGLAELRRAGWPVAALARAVALGADDAAAAAALRYAALDAGMHAVVARALEQPSRADDALAVLSAHPVALEDSPSLVRALEALADPSQQSAERRRSARLLLGGASAGERLERAQDRVVAAAARAVEREAGGAGRAAALTLALEEFTPRWRVRLLAACCGSRTLDGLAPLSAGALAGPLSAEPAESAAQLRRMQPGEALHARWLAACLAGDVKPIVPVLLEQLSEGAPAGALLPALVASGDAEAAAGLFTLWADEQPSERASACLAALGEMVAAQDGLLAALGARVPLAQAEALVECVGLLGQVDGALALVASLERAGRASDPGARRAVLLNGLARLGGEPEGRALLDWIGQQPSGDPLLPLAWATAGALAGEPALGHWAEHGNDPRLLSGVVAATGARRLAALQPLDRRLAPLRRALERTEVRVLPPETHPVPEVMP